MKIPFNKPYLTGNEMIYLRKAHENAVLCGGGPFTQQCCAWLEQHLGCGKAFLTHSGTAALEMAAILADLRPGDEVIMPSYTFVSTANAFVLRGAVPVFVDIRPDTLNLDETQIESAITSRTRAIVPVHYAGLPCEMEAILTIARKHRLLVIEDAAQALMSHYRGKPAGSLGHLAAVSFHETKNIISGEGGALLVNDPAFAERAEIILEKGTDRKKFFRGETDKYTWVDIGSSYLPSDLIGAFLFAQLEQAERILAVRRRIFERYLGGLAPLAETGRVSLPCRQPGAESNAHIFYLLLKDSEDRSRLMSHLKQRGIHSVFHYVPLHSSPAGRKYGKLGSEMKVTDSISSRVLRLPFYYEMTDGEVDEVIREVVAGCGTRPGSSG